VIYSPGGYIPETAQVWLRPGPAPIGGGDQLSIYEDECIINRHGVCIRVDDRPRWRRWLGECVRGHRGHASLPIPADRWWSCPAHGDPVPPFTKRLP
jgi:hypothetical protein